jgi:hypothetical protein
VNAAEGHFRDAGYQIWRDTINAAMTANGM